MAVAAPTVVLAQCVDINADPVEQLTTIAHINEERAVQLIAGRPWPSVRSLTGIGRGRIRDILEQGLACVGVRAPRGQREIIEGATAADFYADRSRITPPLHWPTFSPPVSGCLPV